MTEFRDPIVEEVRRLAVEVEREAGNTVEGYFSLLRRSQQKHTDRLVGQIRKAEPQLAGR